MSDTHQNISGDAEPSAGARRTQSALSSKNGIVRSAFGSARRGWWIVFVGTLVVAAIPMLTPLLSDGGRDIVMAMFSGVCHQLPDRSPHIAGVQLGICHRCTGIYWGLPVAALLFLAVRGAWPVTRRAAPLVLGASVLPAAVDWGGDIAGFWVNTPATRLITGAIFGVVAGYYLSRAVVDAAGSTSPETTSSEPAGSELT